MNLISMAEFAEGDLGLYEFPGIGYVIVRKRTTVVQQGRKLMRWL